MKIDPKSLVAPALAFLVLLLVLQQTMSALRSSGAWREPPKNPAVKPVDPYVTVDRILGRPLLEYAPERKRDPFGYAPPPPTPVVVERRVPTRTPAPPPPAPRPVLTAIIWDNDPRATIRFNNRDFSVRENSLFADFRVRSITSTQVVLDHGGEPLVLTLRPKGD